MSCLTNGHLALESIRYRAQGHELWKEGEDHLKECEPCLEEVRKEQIAFELAEASVGSLSQPRPNKMGTSHSWWRQRMAT